MQTKKTAPHQAAMIDDDPLHSLRPVSGKPLSIGTGFEALSFRHAMFAGAMDPLVMIDHYVMTESTFGPHAHAGMSAVTVLFEDSTGTFNNRDTLGNDIDLHPGDLYWLKAGRGALHDEKPTPGSRAHGLQMFVNLPAAMKRDAAQSLHVRSREMPRFGKIGGRVRVVLGESNGLSGAASPALPMTILDAALDAGGEFAHDVAAGHAVVLVCVNGAVDIHHGGETIAIASGEALAIGPRDDRSELAVRADAASHVALVTAEPVGEAFVQRGPFVMNSESELDEIEADYRAGRLGALTDELARR